MTHAISIDRMTRLLLAALLTFGAGVCLVRPAQAQTAGDMMMSSPEPVMMETTVEEDAGTVASDAKLPETTESGGMFLEDDLKITVIEDDEGNVYTREIDEEDSVLVLDTIYKIEDTTEERVLEDGTVINPDGSVTFPPLDDFLKEHPEINAAVDEDGFTVLTYPNGTMYVSTPENTITLPEGMFSVARIIFEEPINDAKLIEDALKDLPVVKKPDGVTDEEWERTVLNGDHLPDDGGIIESPPTTIPELPKAGDINGDDKF